MGAVVGLGVGDGLWEDGLALMFVVAFFAADDGFDAISAALALLTVSPPFVATATSANSRSLSKRPHLDLKQIRKVMKIYSLCQCPKTCLLETK